MSDWTDTEFLVCRDLQHAWTPVTAHRVSSGFIRVMDCIRCRAVKEQDLDPYGYITGTKIKYPDGYLRPKGDGRLSKHDKAMLRLEIWERS